MEKMIILSAMLSAAWLNPAAAERLDKRFGPDNERGYRSAREYEGRGAEFRNRDRANFLGSKREAVETPELPKHDLQAPARIGRQR